jgi:hypothetical protein
MLHTVRSDIFNTCVNFNRLIILPWGVITTSLSNYLEPSSVPTRFMVKDPSHMKTEEVNRLWNHWKQCSAIKHMLVVFIKAKDSDMCSNL